jgi:hypothetical protein
LQTNPVGSTAYQPPGHPSPWVGFSEESGVAVPSRMYPIWRAFLLGRSKIQEVFWTLPM